jgi:hypothetical protein
MKRVFGLFIVGFLMGMVVTSSAVAGLIALQLYRLDLMASGPVVMRGTAVPGPRPVPPPPEGPLAGLVVYLSAGHGYMLHRSLHDGDPISWGRQRSVKFGMVEDEWTARFVADDLAPVLEEAGATVITLRERDRNLQRIVVDDGFEGFTVFSPEGVEETPSAVGGRHMRLDPGGSAHWKLTAPAAGHWYLYARWVPSPDLDDKAIYTVHMGDEVHEIVVDQRTHGEHWWPLANVSLYEGAPVEVTLTGSGNLPLSADAVRIGGGTYEILLPFNFKMRSTPMWEVAMLHQLEGLGGPDWLFEYECGNIVSDMRLRSHWASWASQDDEEAVYISIHTNASPRGRPKGFTAFWGYESSPPTPADPDSVLLTQLLDEHITAHVRPNDKGYVDRGAREGDYSEISPIHNSLPAALLEMGFHDHPEDAKRLQSAQFRRDAAAGIVDALVAWRESTDPSAEAESDTVPDGRGLRPWVRME